MTPPEEENAQREPAKRNADGENKENDGETQGTSDKQQPEGDANADDRSQRWSRGQFETMVAALKTALGFTVQLSGTVANLS